jgi:hypothetical protein
VEYPVKGRGGKGVQAGTPAGLAWCGLAADLHVPTADGVVVLRPAELEPGRRTGRLHPATAAVTGLVVGEDASG